MIGLFEILGLYTSSISAMFSVCVMLFKLKCPAMRKAYVNNVNAGEVSRMFKQFDFALGFLFYAFQTLVLALPCIEGVHCTTPIDHQ